MALKIKSFAISISEISLKILRITISVIISNCLDI